MASPCDCSTSQPRIGGRAAETARAPGAVINTANKVHVTIIAERSVFLRKDLALFRAGATKHFHEQWCELTSDRFILQAVAGTSLEFESLPVQTTKPKPLSFSKHDFDIVDKIVQEFLILGIIEETVHTSDEFVSNVFIRNKKDGSHRLISNLVVLNTFIEYHHFKMDTIETVINLLRPGCFMTSIDLAKAYFSIPVAVDDRRFLKFQWKNDMYQFTVLPNGLSSAPRIFTKIIKPVYAHLRQLGHLACGYIDDSIVMEQSADSCRDSIMFTEKLFRSLGFSINYAKSEFTPVQVIEHLGFVLNSVNMTVTLPENKKAKLISKCLQVLHDNTCTIRSVAELIGLIVSSFTGSDFGRLHFRQLELDKI